VFSPPESGETQLHEQRQLNNGGLQLVLQNILSITNHIGKFIAFDALSLSDPYNTPYEFSAVQSGAGSPLLSAC